MTKALQTLIAWGRNYLCLKTINVRVRSDNSACEFYQKMNFVELKRVPLKKVIQPDGIQWIECPDEKNNSVSLIYMTFKD